MMEFKVKIKEIIPYLDALLTKNNYLNLVQIYGLDI